MVPAPSNMDFCKEKDVNTYYDKLWKVTNFLQPQETLGCHCIAEFVMCNQSMLNNFD